MIVDRWYEVCVWMKAILIVYDCDYNELCECILWWNCVSKWIFDVYVIWFVMSCENLCRFLQRKEIVVRYCDGNEWYGYDWLCNQSWKWNVMSYKVDGCDETLVDWMLLEIVDWWIVWVINCVESYDCNCELR